MRWKILLGFLQCVGKSAGVTPWILASIVCVLSCLNAPQVGGMAPKLETGKPRGMGVKQSATPKVVAASASDGPLVPHLHHPPLLEMDEDAGVVTIKELFASACLLHSSSKAMYKRHPMGQLGFLNV